VRLRTPTTLLLVLAAGLAAGCGADQEPKRSIPANSARQLEARLAEVQRRFEAGGGACADIGNDSQPAVDSILASLPSSVDRDERSALAQSFDRLFELTAEQCDDQQATTPTETETTPTETTDTTETTPTETTPTETTPTETTPTETTPTETTPTTPPSDDGGDGGDGGGASGPGPGE
jgi:hypothetical protein